MLSNWPSSLQFIKEFDSINSSIKSEESTSTDELDEEQANDGEGIWSPDVEQSFHEALTIYPPCGRRKIILSEEGKMFGRNELISRYIKVRTGKIRTRKQVSSHIQVLSKRKSKDLQILFKDTNFKQTHHSYSHYSTPTSTYLPETNSPYYNYQQTPISIFSPIINSMSNYFLGTNRIKLIESAGYIQSKAEMDFRHYLLHINQEIGTELKTDRININQIIDLFPMLKELYSKSSSEAFYVVKIWVDMDYEENPMNTYHYSSIFESIENNLNICITTKICSFGNILAEKIENDTMKYNEFNKKYLSRSNDTTMCDFMIKFIEKLKKGMYMRDMMNIVLERLGVIQTVVEKETNELLLCIAYIFEISESSGTQSIAYHLCD